MNLLPSLFFILSLVFPSLSVAQEFTFEKAYNDYLFSIEEYSREHNEYLLARSQYKQAGTLAAETKAREETAQMLAARDVVVRNYVQAVRMKLVETNQVVENTKSGLSSRLESEVDWYDNHSARVSSAGSLGDLVRDSIEANNHFQITTVPVVYETLVTVPMAKVSDQRKSLSQVASEVKAFVNTVESQGTHDISDAERWMIQIDGKISRSIDKEIEAQNLLQQLQVTPENDRRPNFSAIYNSAISYLTESHQFMREASTFLSEVVRLIRTKN